MTLSQAHNVNSSIESFTTHFLQQETSQSQLQCERAIIGKGVHMYKLASIEIKLSLEGYQANLFSNTVL